MNNKDILITGVHLEVTEALKNIVHSKAEKLYRHADDIIRIRVELTQEGSRGADEFVAKGRIEIPGYDIHVTENTNDLYKSIDNLMDKLDRQIRQRGKVEKHKRGHPHEIDIPASIPKAN